jgi:CDP-glucose 4,6-dehydratase
VLDPLAGYISLAERLVDANADQFATAFNFGPGADNDANVLQVAQAVARLWGKQASVEVESGPHPPEAKILRLDATKASALLGWAARWDLTQTLERAVEWYKTWRSGQDVQLLMARQLADFAAASK